MSYYPPTLPYCGLTIILDKPSRFDRNKDGSINRLISGTAGDYFDKLLTPFTRYNCDLRLASNTRPLLPNTRVLLLLGQESLNKFKSNSGLLTYRGSPFIISCDNQTVIGLPTITPQDSHDRRNYENPQNEEDEDKEDKETEKDFQKTSRKNFRFWFHADSRKAIRICREGVREYPKTTIHYCSSVGKLVDLLQTNKNQYLVLDIETDAAQNLTCFSFLFSPTQTYDPTRTYEVYVVPFKRYNGTLFYSQLDYCHIFRALTLAFQANTVVGHNLAFDLFILLYKYRINSPRAIYDTMLSHHRCHPEVEKSLGHVVSYYTDLPYHKDEGIFDPKTDEQENKLWQYNAKDVITTFFVMSEQQKEIRTLKATESVAQVNAAQRSLLMMQYEGCLCDTEKLCSIVDQADNKFIQYKRILKLLTQREFNPRSSDQVSEYFYDTLKLPEPVKNPTKEDNLLKLYAKYQVPSLRVVLAARGEGKEASSLRKLILWKGNRLTCQYKLAGQEMFRPSSTALLGFKGNKKNGTKGIRGFGCLKPDAEVLTPLGWKKIETISEIETLMQWDSVTGNLTWCEAKKYETEFEGNLIVYDSWFHKQCYTPEHRIPTLNRKTNLLTERSALETLTLNDWNLPIAGNFSAGKIKLSFIRLLVMIQADGCIEKGSVIRLSFKKPWKISRCQKLLELENIPIVKHSAKDGYERFYIPADYADKYIKYLGESKTFDWWILSLDQETLTKFIQEVKFWDSTRRGQSFIYYTVNKKNAEIISTVAHLTNHSATVSVNLDNNNGYGKGNNQPLYAVAIKPKITCLNQTKNVQTEKYKGKVYCVTTETSFFLTRYNGVISITGNTNMQNWSKRIRPVIVAPPGYVLFQLDQAGADALIVAYLCQMGRFRSLFINKIKPHTFVAMHIAAPVWAEKLGLKDIEEYLQSPIADLKKLKYWADLAKLIADSDGESNPQKRFYYIGKTMCHLLNYDAKAAQFQLSALIKSEGALAFTATQAAYYRNLYRDKLFPEITNFHCDVVRELDSQNRILYNLFGYPRKFNEIWGRELFKQAYCYKPQSSVAVITLLAGTEITSRMDNNEPLFDGLSILQNGFDSLLFSCPEEKWKEVAAACTPHMERELVNHRGEKFKMGSGLAVGKNWGGYDSKKNPLGLREFSLEKNDYK
jgi:DNA polymerase I-like protein with 3'-5' exonuclease and polymerase domains